MITDGKKWYYLAVKRLSALLKVKTYLPIVRKTFVV